VAALLAAVLASSCAPEQRAATVVIDPVAAPDLPASASVSAAPRAPRRAPDGAIAWETSEPDARARARSRRLPFLVYACAEWSVPCLELDRTVWRAPGVVAAARRFVALRLDLTSAEGDAELFAQRYELTAVPTILLFDAEGRRAASLRGYVDADRLAAELARVADE
jgi:thiol:disulfide interchange protein